MSFQPFQLQGVGPLDGIRSFGEALRDMQERKRQAEMDAFNKSIQLFQQKRQEQGDFQSTYQKANALAAAGDMAGAQALMAPFGGQAGQRAIPMPAQPQAPAQPQNQGQAPDQTLSNLTDPNAISEATADADWRTSNPISKAAKASAAENQRMAKILMGKTTAGESWTIDPSQREEATALTRESLANDLKNSGLNPQHVQFGMSMLGMGVDPAKVGQLVAGMTEKDLGRQSTEGMLDKKLGAATALETQKQGGRMELEGYQQTGGKYKHRGTGDGSGGGDGYNPKVERANKAALSQLDSSVGRYAKTSGLQELTKAHEEAERAMESLNTGNPAGAAHALEKFVNVSRGGMATNAALNLFQKHLSGLGGSVEGYIAQLSHGDLGDEQRKNLHDALAQVQHSIKEQVEIKRQAFVKDYVASPAYTEMKGNAEDAYDKLFSPFGYKTEYDPNAKVIALGTGHRAQASGRGAATPAASAPPDAAIQAARARLSNPKETPERKAAAQRFLEEHGIH